MQITDAQVHVWAANTPQRPWPEGGESLAHRPVPLSAKDLLAEMDSAGVHRAVLVPPSWEGDRNDVVLAASKAHPTRFAAMARIDLTTPSPREVDRLLDEEGVKGFRTTFHRPPNSSWLTDGTGDWLWAQSERRPFAVMVLAPHQNDRLASVARRHPSLRLIVDHLNLDRATPEHGIGPAIEELLPLSEIGNVAVKLSALPCFTSDSYPFTRLNPHIARVVAAFGASRCMWGSDLSRLPCGYGEWVEAIRSGMPFLTPAESEAIMGGTIAVWLDWPGGA